MSGSGSKDVATIFRNATRKKLDCPLCVESGFPGEYRLWEHAKQLHRDSLGDLASDDVDRVKKKFVQAALEKACVNSPTIPVIHACLSRTSKATSVVFVVVRVLH